MSKLTNIVTPADAERFRSWFMTYANPKKNILDCADMTNEEVLRYFVGKWIDRNGDNASCAFVYCISAEGLEHIHGVCENPNKVAFKVVREVFPGSHLEATKGTKKQAEDYIFKRGAFKEKGERILCSEIYGEIAGAQGKRTDLDKIEDVVMAANSLSEIATELGFLYWKNEQRIKNMHYWEKQKHIDRIRNVKVIWHTGVSGSGKSYAYQLDPRGDDQIIFVRASNVAQPGCFDLYFGQEVMYLDQIIPGNIKYTKLLELISGEKNSAICRYSNFVPLWNEVHITSTYLPMEFFCSHITSEHLPLDNAEAMVGRISMTVLHFVTDKTTGELVDKPRLRQQVDPENLEYHQLEINGAATKNDVEAAIFDYLAFHTNT